MERSSKCLTLSGVSGILAGIYALIAAWMAYKLIYFSPEVVYDSIETRTQSPILFRLVSIALTTLVLAFLTGLFFSVRKAKTIGQSIWSPASKRMLFNLAVPLIAGGAFILTLYYREAYSLIAGACLLFYGLGLLNAGNFTYSDIRVLGICEILLGLLALAFPGKGLLFWALGFGVLHIVYGTIMYFKYERGNLKSQAPNHK